MASPEKESSETDRLDFLLLDGRHLLWRASSVFYDLAVEKDDGTNQLTGGVYGFLRLAVSAWTKFGGIVMVAWDRNEGCTERRKIFTDYKRKPAGNPRKPSEQSEREIMLEMMAEQEIMLKRILVHLGIRQASSPGWEADDVIATLCAKFGTYKIGILSGDRDLLQLVTDQIRLLRPQPQSSFKVETPSTVLEEFSVTPAQILDLKALAGDSSDNIPGARGIGPKTASKLVQQHGTWERALNWALSIPPSSAAHRALITGADNVRMSAELVKLNRAAKLEWVQEQFNAKAAFMELTKLKFASLMADGRFDQLKLMGGHQP